MKVVIANAFSLNMLQSDVLNINVSFEKLTPAAAAELIKEAGEVVSVVGHADTAAVLTSLLGFQVATNRTTYKWDAISEVILVAQFSGTRLPEGATSLPDGAVLEFFKVSSMTLTVDIEL